MRRRWAIAVVVLGLGGGAAIVLAVTLPGNRGEGRLGVQISELPENAVASVVVTGPGGFSTELSQTTTVGDLSPGRYSVSARPVAVDGTTFYPTISGAPASVTTTSSPEVEVAYITKIPDSTKVLEGATLDSLVSVSPTARVLAFSNESIAFAEGDVLVAGVSPETPRGLLRRVVDVDRGSTRTVLRTEQASLDEAVTRGEVSLERPLSFEGVQRADPLVEGVAFAEGSLVVTIEGTAGKALVVSCRPGVEVRARGRIELDPDFDFSASWGFFDGLKVRATVTTDEDAEVSFTASGSARCSKAVELYRLHFAPITVAVGPVPVVVTPVLTVNLDIEGRVDSSLSVSAVQSASLTAGLAYDDGRVSTIKDFNSEFERPRAEVSPVALSATASAGPRLDLLLYGIVGPSLQAEGYLRLDVTPLDRPWWELLGGLKASARISLDILSGRIKVNLAQATVIDWRRRIAAAKGPAPFPPLRSQEFAWGEPCPRAPADPRLPPWAGCLTVKETDLDGDGDRDQLLLFARPDINGIPSRWEAGAVLDDDLRSTNRVDVAPRYPDACYPTFCYPTISGVVDADGKPGAEAFFNTGPAGAAYVGFVILSVNRDDLVLVEPGTDESETLGDLRVGGSNIHGAGFECRPSTGELRVYSIYMSEKATWTWDSITYIWTNDKSLIVADARSGVIRARGPNDQRVFRYYSSSCGALVFDS